MQQTDCQGKMLHCINFILKRESKLGSSP